jgi:DNA-binding NarL/FixJ family response regulator
MPEQEYVDLEDLKKIISNKAQIGVLEGLLEGKTSKKIASELNISMGSVKYIRSKIHRMFGTKTATELKSKIRL